MCQRIFNFSAFAIPPSASAHSLDHRMHFALGLSALLKIKFKSQFLKIWFTIGE